MLADPVAGVLCLCVEEIVTALNDKAADILPDRTPVVTVTRRVPRKLCADRQRKEDSDSHSVAAQVVDIIRNFIVDAKIVRP